MKPLLITAQIGFLALTITCFIFLLGSIKRALMATSWDPGKKNRFFNRMIIALVVWAAFVTGWSVSGIMGNFSLFPFNVMPVVLIPLITILVLVFSGTLDDILQHMSASKLATLQGFRFFVELLLWALFIENLLPEQMTFEGRNFDILAGMTGPFVGFLVSRNRLSPSWIVGWNLVCLGLLVNIVSIAVVSMPGPLRIFMNEPANTIVTTFPVSLLPAFLVPLAYTLHFLAIRQVFVLGRLPREVAQ